MYHHGWLQIVDVNGEWHELFNHARTSDYLSNSPEPGCARVSNVLLDGGCKAYRYTPELDPLSEECEWYEWDEWSQPEGAPGLPPAPWYNPRYPESAKALGFWVEEWTGLDSGHIQRGMTSVGGKRGGGQLGRVTSNHREMAFEIFLFGTSERALDYLFRWLDATLSSVCATCATNTIMLRRFCPDLDEPTEHPSDGVVEMRGVGLMQGLEWAEEPIERMGCFMRRATFTLAAEDPCMYSFATGVPVDASADLYACLSEALISPSRNPCRPTCSELDATCRTWYTFDVDSVSASSPRVTLVNDGPGPTIPTRLRIYSDPAGVGVAAGPCGLPLVAELYVRPLPESSELIWDGPGSQVLFRDASTGGPIGGFQFIDTNQVGVPRFAGLGCDTYHVVMEPALFCLTDLGGGAFSDGFNSFFPPRFPGITVDLQERMGCA